MLEILVFFLWGIVPWFCCRTVSSLDYGFQEAKTDIECYYVLQRTHKVAVEKGGGRLIKGLNRFI